MAAIKLPPWNLKIRGFSERQTTEFGDCPFVMYQRESTPPQKLWQYHKPSVGPFFRNRKIVHQSGLEAWPHPIKKRLWSRGQTQRVFSILNIVKPLHLIPRCKDLITDIRRDFYQLSSDVEIIVPLMSPLEISWTTRAVLVKVVFPLLFIVFCIAWGQTEFRLTMDCDGVKVVFTRQRHHFLFVFFNGRFFFFEVWNIKNSQSSLDLVRLKCQVKDSRLVSDQLWHRVRLSTGCQSANVAHRDCQS